MFFIEPVVCTGDRTAIVMGNRTHVAPKCYTYKKKNNAWEDEGGKMADESTLKGQAYKSILLLYWQ